MRKLKLAAICVGTAALIATGGTMTAGATTPATTVQSASAGTAAKTVDPKGAHSTDVSVTAYSCTRGAVCFYTGTKGTGKKYQRFVNTNNNYNHISSAWNNGRTDEALDHVKVKWNYTGSGTTHWGCLSPGEKWSGSDYTVDAIRWVKSC
ncbi:peptidase inhibitor family I36 protein [Streptomyces diacarni]|uniref:peptidase inhibitor family I36 protein n=1 Tax=Streptomyces diacarni TaxID=2800381 RepID=UPI0033F2AA43